MKDDQIPLYGPILSLVSYWTSEAELALPRARWQHVTRITVYGPTL